MKRDRGEKKVFFFANVSRPSNPPDELAQNVSKKIPFGRIIPPFFFESSESDRVFNYLHDSNSIFWARGINSEIFSGGTVVLLRLRNFSDGIMALRIAIHVSRTRLLWMVSWNGFLW